MSYAPDLGGNFASDVHRRVLAHLPTPTAPGSSTPGYISDEDLAPRLALDEHTNVGFDETAEILADLEADGDAAQSKDGWKQTKKGHDALSGPIATDGGRAHE